MNSVDINFSEFGPPIKLIIIDPKKYKSRFKTGSSSSTVTQSSSRHHQHQQQHRRYSAFEYPNHHHHQHQQNHKVPTCIPRSPEATTTATDKPEERTLNSERAPTGDSGPEASLTPIPAAFNGKSTAEKDGRRRSELLIEEDEISEEEDERQLRSFLTTEQTTRAGRVSKKTKLFNTPNSDAPTEGIGTGTEPLKPKVKKRKPADVFRCKTCSKYYVGHTKLRLHYKKNPDHKIPSKSTSTTSTTTNTAEQNEGSTSASDGKELNRVRPAAAESPDIVILKSCTSIGVQANLSQEVQQNGNNEDEGLTSKHRDPTLILLNDQIPPDATRPLTLELESDNTLSDSTGENNTNTRRRMLEPITVPLTSGNVMSPGENSMHAAMTTLTMGEEIEFRCTTTTNERTGATSASSSPINDTTTSNFEAGEHSDKSANNSSTLSSSTSDNDSTAAMPMPLPSKSPPKMGSKLIWEYIEEKMVREGINQILTEISDVAEKLSKIARDKIIPIREEEEERLQSSVPIIQVDNPFLSHLLDLPFGTYIFKEDDDEDSRRIPPPPPPSITELSQFSLTGGAEVDIDKFLTPESANVLPHLTNLDFNAICNAGSASNSSNS